MFTSELLAEGTQIFLIIIILANMAKAFISFDHATQHFTLFLSFPAIVATVLWVILASACNTCVWSPPTQSDVTSNVKHTFLSYFSAYIGVCAPAFVCRTLSNNAVQLKIWSTYLCPTWYSI